jgi:pectin methylesterase-like acyl-CoA thioesterase
MILRKLLMLVFLAVAVCIMSAGVGAAAMITVDDSGGVDFTSIQAAVNNASSNGRVDIGDAAKIAFYLAGKVSEL